jgi:uncharacterized 2Fe-2S/4Fe-4S cluster protein (DUF4445 family)
MIIVEVNMTKVDEKEILEIEKLKAEVAKIPLEVEKIKNDMLVNNKKYMIEAWKLAFYGVAVGLGGTFAIAKTISLMGW